MGRDRFFKLLKWNGMLVKKSKNFITTTNSKHRFFKNPNRILDLEIKQSEQVWVSDITYVKLQNDYAYLALVTDAYSKCCCRADEQNSKVRIRIKRNPTRFENCSENDPASCKPLQQPSIALFTQFSNPCKSAPQRKCKI